MVSILIADLNESILDLSCNSNWMTAPQAIEVTSTSTNSITANFSGFSKRREWNRDCRSCLKCVLYENNIANAPNSFVNTGAGVFTLYYNGNNQTYTQMGVTPGTSTSCPFP